MGVFSVCSAGAAGWAAGAGMLSFLDFFALKAEASYMRVHGQKRGTAAKKAVCYNRRSFSSCNPGWAGNFQNQAGRSPADGNGNRRKARLVIDIFYYSPIWLKIQAVSTFFPCFFRERRAVLGERGTERWNRRVQGREQKRDNEQFTPGATDKPHTVWCGACHLYNANGGHKKSPRTEVRGEQT